MTNAAALPAAAPLRLRFDATDCSRCSGTGHVAPWGVCFRCGGMKRFRTAAGKRAAAAWDAFRAERGITVGIDGLALGERRFVPRLFVGPQNGGTYLTFRAPLEIVKIERGVSENGARYADVHFRVSRRPDSSWVRFDEPTSSVVARVFESDTSIARRPTRDELLAFADSMQGRKGWALVETEAAK